MELGDSSAGGTYRLVDDAVRLLKPGGAAHFVTEDLATAKFLTAEANRHGLRAAFTKMTKEELVLAAPGASGAGVQSMKEIIMVNIYKLILFIPCLRMPVRMIRVKHNL
jgi:hypothetical protein